MTGTQGRVVVGGTINTDLVARAPRAPRQGETVTGTDFAIFGGGKGANQAVAAARSGAAVAMVGGLGEDTFGDDRLQDLRAEGIDVSAVTRVPGVASGVALITVEEGGDNRIVYVPGSTLAVTTESALSGLGKAPIAVLLLTLELSHEVIAALIRHARGMGTTVILNATPDPETARPYLGDVDVLIVNETEALALAGATDGESDWEAIGKELVAGVRGDVVLTLGAAGALVVGRDGSMHLPSLAVEVVDTTGAGDTLCGATAAAIADGLPLAEAVRRGVVAGALACTVAGAQPSIPSRERIAAHLPAV